MIFKILVLVAFCTFHGTQAKAIRAVSPETLVELQKAILETQDATSSSSRDVNAVRFDIEIRIEEALKPVNDEFSDFLVDIEKAKQDAKNQGFDIDDCINSTKAAATNIDIDKIRKCGNSDEVKQADNLVGELGDLIYELHDAAVNCANEVDDRDDDEDDDDDDKCVVEIIDDVRQKTKTLQGEISDLLANIDRKKQGECMSKEAENLKNQLDEIINEWNECLEAHQHTTASKPI